MTIAGFLSKFVASSASHGFFARFIVSGMNYYLQRRPQVQLDDVSYPQDKSATIASWGSPTGPAIVVFPRLYIWGGLPIAFLPWQLIKHLLSKSSGNSFQVSCGWIPIRPVSEVRGIFSNRVKF